jgi:phage terminase large subunit
MLSLVDRVVDQSESSLELPPIRLNRKQDDFIFAKEEFVCIKGTWGCGKSLAGLIAADRECQENPGNLYLVTRKEWVDLRDSTMKDWASEIGRPIVSGDVRYPNGSTLMFRHGNDLNSLKNSNLGGALMVQAEEEAEETFWFLKGRLRRKQGTRQLRLECNYDGRNWIYRLFDKQGIGRLIRTNTFDNQQNLPPDYIPGLMKLPKKLQERHLYGSDADMEGQVWDEFKIEYVIPPFDVPKEWEGVIALDHGVTNPTAVLWGFVDFDGKVYITDEHYEAGKIISYHAEQIKSRNNESVKDWLFDPACMAKTNSKNGQLYSVWDEYSDCGLSFRPANNSVLAGINRVNEYFKTGRLFIFKNCINLIQEIENYKWQKLKPGIEKNEPDAPVKKNDHACDALRYLIMSRPETEVDSREKFVSGSMEEFEWLEQRQAQRQREINGEEE